MHGRLRGRASKPLEAVNSLRKGGGMKVRRGFGGTTLVLLSLAGSACLPGQTWVETHGPVDPARTLPLAAEPQRALLPEQYIWTANDAAAVADGARYVQHNQT
jgi:hypothetical protein